MEDVALQKSWPPEKSWATVLDEIRTELSWCRSSRGADGCEKIVIVAKKDKIHAVAANFAELYKQLLIYNQLSWRYTKYAPVEGDWKVVTLCHTCEEIISVGDPIPSLYKVRAENPEICWSCWSNVFYE